MRVSEVNGYLKTNNKVATNITKSNFMSFQAEPDKVEITRENKESKKTWAYALGGLAVAAAIVYAVKKHNLGTLPGEIKPKVTPDIPSSPDVKPQKHTKRKSYSSISSKSKTAKKSQAEVAPSLETKPSKWMLSEKEKSKITINPSGGYKIRTLTGSGYADSNDVNEVVERIIKESIKYQSITKKDAPIAREVLPVLIKNSDAIEIGGYYHNFLKGITQENKDFKMGQVVPLFAKNYRNMNLSDWRNNGEFMHAITPENIKYFQRLADVSKVANIRSSENFRGILESINEKNADFIFKKAIPSILKNKDAMLKPEGKEVENLVKMLTPENITRVFKEDLPMILANSEKLKIKYAGDIVSALGAVNRCGKDSFFNEILPILNQNEQKFHFRDNFDYQNLLDSIEPNCKDKLTLIAQNPEKLHIISGYSLSEALKKSEQEILASINN